MSLWSALGEVDGFLEGPSVFSDDDTVRAWFVNGTEVAHMDGPSCLALRLTRKVVSAHRAELKTEPRVDLRRSGSDWITVGISDAGVDTEQLALRLAELAAAAHRPAPGVTPKPPPSGSELARRRRFH